MRNEKAALLLTFIIIMTLLSSGCLFNIKPVIEAISDQIGKVGQEFTYQVIAYDPDNGELTYSLNEKPEDMEIGNSTGLITWTPGESQIGTFTVEVKASNGNSFSVKQFKITIEDIYLNSLEVSPAAINVYVGNSNTITSVTAHYDNGDSADLALADCEYTSGNTNIAMVDNSWVITGISAGSTIITVSYTEDGIVKTDTVSVTIEDIFLDYITVFPSTMSMYSGSLKNITSITAHYNDGSSASVELSSANYSSNNPGIASVNTTGGITGVSTGAAIITVTYTEDGIVKTDIVNVIIISPDGGGGGGG